MSDAEPLEPSPIVFWPDNRKPLGRPRKYASPEEFDAAVEDYITECRQQDEPITWTGMALALGFTSRQAMDTYAEYPGFSDSVRRAKALVEQAYERRLHGTTPTGAIFALKNFGWKDKQEIEHSGEVGGVLRVGTPQPAADWGDAARRQQTALPPGSGNGTDGHGGTGAP